nr:MAG TPA: hypothetical protein [Bacteriophage sp.]
MIYGNLLHSKAFTNLHIGSGGALGCTAWVN